MPHTPNTWNVGDKITKTKLDRLEQAAKAGADGAEAAPDTYAPLDAVDGKLGITEAENTYAPVATLPPYVYQEARFAVADDTGVTSGPDWTKVLLLGSSLTNGYLSRATTLATENGATVLDATGSGQSAEHIFARLGSRPLKTGGFVTIPASGTVVVPSSNVSSLSYATVNYHGYFEGHPERPGVLSKANVPAAGYTFTPDATGSAISLAVGTKFIPTLPLDRTMALVGNWAKNNATGVPGGTGDIDKCIQWTLDAVNYWRAKGHPIIVMGHYADVGAAPDVVAKIKKYNTSIKAALGWRYLDLYEVFSPNDSLLPAYAAGDGIHLNTAGNNLLDTMIRAAIDAANWFPDGLNLAASLVASFRGDDIAGVDGDPVNSWVSRGGTAGALTFTPTPTAPDLNVGGFQGHKTVILDAAATKSLSTPTDSIALTAATYVAIFKVLSTTGTGQNIISGHSTTYHRIYTSTSGTVMNASGLSTNELNTGVYGALGDWLIVVARFNGSDGSLATNGTTAVGQLTASAQSRLRLGVNAGGTSGRANAEVAAVDIYSKALNDDEVTAAVDAMVASLAA